MFLKFERRAGDFATVSVAVQLTLDKDGSCKKIRICLGAVGSTVIEAKEAEKLLTGTDLNREIIERASEKASMEAEPGEDIRGSVEYKREMVRVFTQRALKMMVDKAREIN